MTKNILVIDAGNTNVVFGLYINEKLEKISRYETETFKPNLELLDQFTDGIKVDFITVASVVPPINNDLESVIKDYFSVIKYNFPLDYNQPNYIFITGLTPLGMKYNTEKPELIGADLIANAFSVWNTYKSDCIICDFGTATTIQLVRAEGFYEGVIIMPGLKTSLVCLTKNAVQLKYIELEPPKSVLGTNTKDALLSGIVKGHSHTIDGFINEIKGFARTQSQMQTIFTGGLAEIIAKEVKSNIILDKNLTLDGLFLISKKYIVTK
jgi:type III pantothenate kinase